MRSGRRPGRGPARRPSPWPPHDRPPDCAGARPGPRSPAGRRDPGPDVDPEPTVGADGPEHACNLACRPRPGPARRRPGPPGPGGPPPSGRGGHRMTALSRSLNTFSYRRSGRPLMVVL